MGYYRISLVLNNKEQYEEWKKYQNKKAYGNFSQMIRSIIQKVIENDKEPFKESLEPIKNALDSIYRLTETTNECVDFINMRLENNKEKSEIIKAAREILSMKAKGEMAISEIIGKFNYGPEIIKAAVVLIYDLGIFGTKIKDFGKMKDDSEEIE